MSSNESMQDFVNRLSERESLRAAERARQEAEYLAMTMWRIHRGVHIQPDAATPQDYGNVQSAVAILSDRIRRNDHGIDENVLRSYVERGATWVEKVVLSLFEQAGR